MLAAAVDFFRLEPLGSSASSSVGNVGSISEPLSDEVDFTFFAEAGEVVTAVVTPTNPGAVLTVEYAEDVGVTATATSPGESVVLPAGDIVATGTATVRVTGTSVTDFTLNIYRNTTLEVSVGESTTSNPIDLGPSQLDIGGRRYAGLGATSLDPTQTVLYSEAFESAPGYALSDLWHVSDGRSSDGQSNHAGSALYFGQAEDPADFVGTFSWDAELDATNNNLWESNVNDLPGSRWGFSSASAPGTSGPSSNLNGITEWYDFGASATMESIEASLGDSTTKLDTTWELVFRPRDFTGTHVLFETGGNGDGTAFLLDGNTLEFRVQDANDESQRVVRTFTFDAINDVNEFHHITATVHPSAVAASNSVRLYVNGIEAGSPVSATGVLSDWGGTDGSGLGVVNGAFPDDTNTTLTGDFDGDIAKLRFRAGTLFNAGEVKSSYDDLVNDFPYRIGNYDTGAAVGGDASSPGAIALTGGAEYQVSFNTLVEVEDADEPFELMQLVVKNTSTLVEEVLLDRLDGGLPTDTNGQWSRIEADLSGFAGQTVQLIFRFDSVDGTNNDFEGWWVDDVMVSRSDAPPTVDDDRFTIDLSGHVGEEVDIVLAGQRSADYAGQTLELRSSDGSLLLATGVSDPIQANTDAENYDLGILGYSVVAGGDYTIRVASDAGLLGEEYSVVVTPQLAMESEPNGIGDPLRSLNGTRAGVGFLRSTGFQEYASRAAFDAENPSLTLEDFESGNVDAEDLTSFPGPLSSSTSNSAFAAGIAAGLSISSGPVPGGDVALVGGEFFDDDVPGSNVVGADNFSSDTTLTFGAGVFAVGMDIFDEGDVVVAVLDSLGGLIVSSLITADPSGTFFGVSSNTAIGTITLIEVGNVDGELVDNVAFGATAATPLPDDDFFRVTLQAGQSFDISTTTPLDNASNSLWNSLDPSLQITGPGIATELIDSNSAADGKNALISFTPSVAGEFTIRVSPESGQGEYVLHIGGDSVLPCDYVGSGNGCDINDIDALFAGTNGAPTPLSDLLIAEWLTQASDASNPLKADSADTYVYGDVDLNGDVDSTDLGLLLNNFSSMSGLGWGAGNQSADANIDSTDLGLLLNNFGFESATTAAVSVTVTNQAVKADPLDTNGDGLVAPMDALRIMNALSSGSDTKLSHAEALMLDVDGDGDVTPLDAMIVMNHLNAESHRVSITSVSRAMPQVDEADEGTFQLIDQVFAGDEFSGSVVSTEIRHRA